MSYYIDMLTAYLLLQFIWFICCNTAWQLQLSDWYVVVIRVPVVASSVRLPINPRSVTKVSLETAEKLHTASILEHVVTKGLHRLI